MNQTWAERVSVYLDELQQCAVAIDGILDQSNVHTVKLDHAMVQQSTDDLSAALDELKQKFSEREDLLGADDAPPVGASLTEKLSRSEHSVHRDLVAHRDLAARCSEIADVVAMANQRAVSLFVCQYHLLDLSSDIVRMLTGAMAPPTYGADANRSAGGGGTLFNEAA